MRPYRRWETVTHPSGSYLDHRDHTFYTDFVQGRKRLLQVEMNVCKLGSDSHAAWEIYMGRMDREMKTTANSKKSKTKFKSTWKAPSQKLETIVQPAVLFYPVK